LKVIVTASGAVWVIDTRVGLRTTPVSSDLDWATKFVSRAAPLQGVPSWKTRLGRSVTVHAV
jgi:hypothetical protein